MRTRNCAAFVAACAALAASLDGQTRPPAAPADLVLRNGRIVTVDEARPEAQALAVAGDTIVASGSNQDIQRYVGASTRVIDLAGALAVPGFIDSHAHFTGVGQAARNLKLAEAADWPAIVQMVAEAARQAKPGAWILGRGWHQEKWTRRPSPEVDGFPVHDAVSKVSPQNPVWLTHASRHAGFANARAMELAGVTPATADPQGGTILKTRDGRPTGLFNERAQTLIATALARDRARRSPAEIEADLRRDVELAAAESLSKGLTTVTDAGSPPSTIDRARRSTRASA